MKHTIVVILELPIATKVPSMRVLDIKQGGNRDMIHKVSEARSLLARRHNGIDQVTSAILQHAYCLRS